MTNWKILVTTLSIACMLLVEPTAPHAEAGEEERHVVVWSYYSYPPFVMEGNQGLTHDFLEMLNSRSMGKYSFHLILMPRKRIDLHLKSNDPGIVLFVNPAWMDDPDKSKYQWTSTLFADRNGIISNISKQLNYTGPESVQGLRLGGVFGRKYKGLEESIRQGRILREDVVDEELNVLKVSERRVDFMTAPESVLRYLVNRLGVKDRVHFSPTPLFNYTRHILINNEPPELQAFLMQFVKELPTNPEWLALMRKYDLR